MGAKRTINLELGISILIVFLTSVLMFAYYSRWFSFAATVGPFRIIHYLAFIGTFYIAFGVILFSVLKRRNPQKYTTLLRLHAIGNLVAFLLVSLHFAGQLGRPVFPELGTGLALYIGMMLLVGSGVVFRFRFLRSANISTTRFVHTGVAVAFYIIIVVHILHGLNVF